MPGRRAFLQRVFGGAGVASVLGVPSTRPAQAAQRKVDPSCPTCGRVFGLVTDNTGIPGQLIRTPNCIHAALSDIFTPGKRWPVRCQCGWSGTAVFYEAQEA